MFPDTDSSDLTSSSGLNISFSMTLTAQESAALTSALSQNMQLHVENVNRREIGQPPLVINRPSNASFIKSVLTPGHHLLLVHAGNTAEKVKFQLKNGVNNELKVSAAGKSFDLQVNYQCQGALDSQISADRAKQALTFFKIVEITAGVDGSLRVTPFAGNLTDYDLGAAAVF